MLGWGRSERLSGRLSASNYCDLSTWSTLARRPEAVEPLVKYRESIGARKELKMMSAPLAYLSEWPDPCTG